MKHPFARIHILTYPRMSVPWEARVHYFPDQDCYVIEALKPEPPRDGQRRRFAGYRRLIEYGLPHTWPDTLAVYNHNCILVDTYADPDTIEPPPLHDVRSVWDLMDTH